MFSWFSPTSTYFFPLSLMDLNCVFVDIRGLIKQCVAFNVRFIKSQLTFWPLSRAVMWLD